MVSGSLRLKDTSQSQILGGVVPCHPCLAVPIMAKLILDRHTVAGMCCYGRLVATGDPELMLIWPLEEIEIVN